MSDDPKKVVNLAAARNAVSAQKANSPRPDTETELDKLLRAAEKPPMVAHEPSKALISFPTDWKLIVREIVELYQEQEGKGDKVLGFTKLRDRIMEQEDITEDGKRVRDSALTRQDLQNWILYGKVLTDPKFWFVDKFVRRLQISDDQVMEKMQAYIESRHADVLSHIFQTQHRAHRQELKKFADIASDRFLVSAVLPDDQAALFSSKNRHGDLVDVRQMGLLIRASTTTIFGLTLVYSDQPLTVSNFGEILSSVVIKYGYLIPQYESSPGYLSGMILSWSEDEFSSKQSAFSDFQYSQFYIDFRKGCMFVKAGQSTDDPLGWSTQVRWKQTNSKFSPFATELSDDYTDYETKLTDLSADDSLIKHLKSLKNRYLIW